MLNILIRSCLCFLFLSVSGCNSETPKEIDPYFLKLEDQQLVIPARYLTASDAAHRRNRKLAEQYAQTPPGMPTMGIFMMLDSQMYPLTYSQTNQMERPPDYIRLYLQVRSASVANKTSLPPTWNPVSVGDEYGLEIYRESKELTSPPDVPLPERNFAFTDKSGELYVINCDGFGLPNPGCEAHGLWHGLILQYDANYTHLHEWKVMHEQIISLLDSFVVAKNHP